MNSTLQHAATLTLIVPWRKGDVVTGENEEVSYLTVCGSIQTFVLSSGHPPLTFTLCIHSFFQMVFVGDAFEL